MSYQSNGLRPITIDLARSSPSRSVSPLPSAPPDVLKIANAPEDVVRAVLIALCQDPMQKRKAMLHMEKLNKLKSEQPQSESIKGDASTGDINGSTNQTGTKKTNKRRAVAEMAICENCNEPFSQDTNSPEACHYHPGEMECDDHSDFWADHDDDCHGDRYSKELMEEYPEGYIWSCCQQSGVSAGCTLGSHEGLYKKPYNQTSLIW
ncbi:hypothetical protein RRF57_003368 [Xylaria bambusicola]|uniref:C2H2-type domain-containing protein n=1 Tax=Xylaria bambusicola TaxID=326684 RepID=A0AAN7Z5C7_9PEZI